MYRIYAYLCAFVHMHDRYGDLSSRDAFFGGGIRCCLPGGSDATSCASGQVKRQGHLVDALVLKAMKDVTRCDKPWGAESNFDPRISEWGNPPVRSSVHESIGVRKQTW